MDLWSAASDDGVNGHESTQLTYPTAVLVDTNGYIYINNVGNNQIIRQESNSDFGVYIVACSGIRGMQVDQLSYLQDLAFDSHGSSYVSDSLNNQIQKH